MKLRDLTINQIVEICKSRSACEDCPLAVEFIASHTRYTKCMVDNLFFLSEPRKCGEYIMNKEVMDVDAGEITRCADCTHADTAEKTLHARLEDLEQRVNWLCEGMKPFFEAEVEQPSEYRLDTLALKAAIHNIETRPAGAIFVPRDEDGIPGIIGYDEAAKRLREMVKRGEQRNEG